MISAAMQNQNTLIQCWQQWGWLDGLGARGADTLLIADADVLQTLRVVMGAHRFRTAIAGAHAHIVMTDVHEIIVFCRTGELAFVRALKTLHPDVTVASATYDYLPVSLLEQRFERYPPDTVEESSRRMLNLIITAPGSGVDDLCDLMDAHKMGRVRRALTPAAAFWARQQTDFQILRFFEQLARCARAARFDLLIETDALMDMVAAGRIPQKKLFARHTLMPVNVLYFTRRAKVVQALLLAAARGAPESDNIGDLPEPQRDFSAIDKAMIDLWIEKLLRLEIAIEAAMETVVRMKNVTLEDLHGAPDNVLPDVAVFFKKRLPKRQNYQLISAAVRKVNGVDDIAKQHSKTLIARLGLRVGKEGSFVSIIADGEAG